MNNSMVLEFYVLATKVSTFSFDFLPKPYFTSWCCCGDSGCVLVVVVCSVMVAVRRRGFCGLSLAAKGLRRGSSVDCFSGAGWGQSVVGKMRKQPKVCIGINGV
ncbi:hypothetical protein HanRHA438_Chr08g0365831 [Helianthus annuus]|nr:hypothetical protein HanRHA438_Chr08g0365831 [Helianthus annuus]